jgi:hypothetical protein
MNSTEFYIAISSRLLLPVLTSSFCSVDDCGTCLDPFGYHLLNCQKNNSSFKIRHDIVRDALSSLAFMAGFQPVCDAPVQCLGLRTDGWTKFRPADILIAGDNFTRTSIDVTVTSSIVGSNCSAVHVPEALAKTREDAKFLKHDSPCQLPGYGFQAFSVDIFGGIGPDSLALLRRFAYSYAKRSGKSPSHAHSICYRRISFAIHLAAARQIQVHPMYYSA